MSHQHRLHCPVTLSIPSSATCELFQLHVRVSALNKFNATLHVSIRFVRKFFCPFVFAMNSLDPILSGTFFGGGANIGGGGRQPESNQQPWPWQPSSFLLFCGAFLRESAARGSESQSGNLDSPLSFHPPAPPVTSPCCPGRPLCI